SHNSQSVLRGRAAAGWGRGICRRHGGQSSRGQYASGLQKATAREIRHLHTSTKRRPRWVRQKAGALTTPRGQEGFHPRPPFLTRGDLFWLAAAQGIVAE